MIKILIIIFGLLVSNALNEEDDNCKKFSFKIFVSFFFFLNLLVDYIGGFDTTQIMSQNINYNQGTLPRSGHIRLEPLYA